MIVQNPLVPPLPSVSNNATSPVANAPAASQNDRPETALPVKATESVERTAQEDRGRTDADSRGAERERGQELDIEV
jgi:hypothetical protein